MTALSDLIAVIEKSGKLHDTLAHSSPQLARGQVWCHKCGRTEHVNSSNCLRRGWPLCCGETMAIDSPEERAALKAREAAR